MLVFSRPKTAAGNILHVRQPRQQEPILNRTGRTVIGTRQVFSHRWTADVKEQTEVRQHSGQPTQRSGDWFVRSGDPGSGLLCDRGDGCDRHAL